MVEEGDRVKANCCVVHLIFFSDEAQIFSAILTDADGGRGWWYRVLFDNVSWTAGEEKR